eukprot:1118204-Pelagomonas_calceolata.AAC.4
MQALRQSSAGQGISSRSAGSVRRVAVAKPVVSRPVVAWWVALPSATLGVLSQPHFLGCCPGCCTH